MRILIADDERVSRRMLHGLLTMWGYEVISVEDGNKALEELKKPDAPRVGLLDWVMPGQNGVEVCRAIRRDRPEPYTYLILLTTKDAKENIVEGLESGADDYLIKPWDPYELKARLRAGQRILQLEDRLVEARETMRFKATHDHLTGLANRGFIVDSLERELARTRRENGSTIVMLGDLDHFKSVNDTYGHPVGDEVLREVARRLLGAVRSYDLVGRYGGEEFLIVLNNCDASQALARAEEVRKGVARDPVHTAIGPLPVTMSIGVLSSRDWSQCNAEEMLRRVDAALYQAKASGRNCCQLAGPNVPCEVPSIQEK
jgi:two-component system cell cycle response regulator